MQIVDKNFSGYHIFFSYKHCSSGYRIGFGDRFSHLVVSFLNSFLNFIFQKYQNFSFMFFVADKFWKEKTTDTATGDSSASFEFLEVKIYSCWG